MRTAVPATDPIFKDQDMTSSSACLGILPNSEHERCELLLVKSLSIFWNKNRRWWDAVCLAASRETFAMVDGRVSAVAGRPNEGRRPVAVGDDDTLRMWQ